MPISAVAANFLQYLLPSPNTGPVDSYANNYQINMPTPISSNQFDARVDQNLGSKQQLFGRVSYKKRSVVSAPLPNCPWFCEDGRFTLDRTVFAARNGHSADGGALPFNLFNAPQ